MSVIASDARVTIEGKPFVVLLIDDKEYAQLTPEECLQMGMRFMQSAIEAERDAGLVRFVTATGGEDEGEAQQMAAVLLQGLRDHRDQADVSGEGWKHGTVKL